MQSRHAPTAAAADDLDHLDTSKPAAAKPKASFPPSEPHRSHAYWHSTQSRQPSCWLLACWLLATEPKKIAVQKTADNVADRSSGH